MNKVVKTINTTVNAVANIKATRIGQVLTIGAGSGD